MMEHTGRYYEVLVHQLSEANLFVSAINPKLIKDFDNDSLRKVKSDKADAVKIARFALDKWQNLKQYSVMDVVPGVWHFVQFHPVLQMLSCLHRYTVQ